MTLIRGTNPRGGLSSLGGAHTTIYGEESLIENGEIEELHYLSVKVESMKKAMLNRVEGTACQSEMKSKVALAGSNGQDAKKTGNLIIDENDLKEEMLYRSMDNLIDTQTGGGDILNSNGQAVNSSNLDSKLNASQQ